MDFITRGKNARLGGFGGILSRGLDPSLLSPLRTGAAQLIAHPLEYGSMFQDRFGATPVTEPGQQLGLALDWGFTGRKPVLGVELVDFAALSDQGTGWIKEDDVIKKIDDDSTLYDIGAPVVSGKTYEIRFTKSNHTAGNPAFYVGGILYTGLILPGDPAGEYVSRLVAGPNGTITIRAASARIWFSSFSVRELPGYHATAISDAARGIYREVGGLKYIEWNGVNTAYKTIELPAPGVDKAQVFAGVRKLSDDARGVVLEMSPTIASNNGAMALFAPNSAADNFAFESKGTTLQSAIGSGIAAPVTRVLTGLGDISGDLATLRINGTQVAQSTDDQGTGNFNPDGTYPLYYGARGGTSLFFEGHHYGTLGPIVRISAANATADQIAAAEAYYTTETGL